MHLEGQDRSTVAEIDVSEGDCLDFILTWGPSHLPLPASFNANEALERTQAFWEDWAARCK